jgi:hypothetical protein
MAETYSYTLTEAMQAGCHVLAADVGALGTRIKNTAADTLCRRAAAAAVFERDRGHIR